MDKPILSSRTGGISLLSLILLIGGIGCLTIQIAGFWGETSPEMGMASRFAPSFFALALFLLFFWTGRKGSIDLFADRIQGKKASGKGYSIPLNSIDSVDLNGRHLLVKGKDKLVLLSDKAPAYRRLPGLIWMLVQYPELRPLIANTFEEDSPSPTAIRMFSEAEQNVSGDAGFLLNVAGTSWYLPMTDSKPAPKPIDNQKSLSTNLLPGNPILKFEPNPERLPLRAVWKALSESSPAIQAHWAAVLVEAHGGVELQKSVDLWTAELNGMQVRVHETGSDPA